MKGKKVFKFAGYVPDFPPGILSGWAKGLNPGSPIRNLPREWGENKREIPEWTPGKDRSCEKTTSESRRSAHALKGWGAVSGPPCAGRLSPKEYEPVRRYRSGRKSKRNIRGDNKKEKLRKIEKSRCHCY